MYRTTVPRSSRPIPPRCRLFHNCHHCVTIHPLGQQDSCMGSRITGSTVRTVRVGGSDWFVVGTAPDEKGIMGKHRPSRICG